MSILNLQYFLGLGVGMLIGYRPGFLARPYGYSHTRSRTHTYADEHKGQTYNKRKDGLIECATSKTTNYIKVTETLKVKIKLSNQFKFLYYKIEEIK